MGDAFILRRGGVILRSMELVTPPERTSFVAGEFPDLTGIVCRADVGGETLFLGAESLRALPNRALTESDTEMYAQLTLGGVSKTVTVPVSIVEPSTTFNNNTWAVIGAVARAGRAQEYWNIGSVKQIYDKNGVFLNNAIIADFDHDALHPDDPYYGTDYNGAGRLAAMSLYIGVFAADMTHTGATGLPMNSLATNEDGWRSSMMRSKSMQDVYGALPDDLQRILRTAAKVTSAGKRSTELITTGDKVFLPSETETRLVSPTISVPGEGATYNQRPAYAALTNYFVAKGAGAYEARVWLRSPDKTYTDAFAFYNAAATVILQNGKYVIKDGSWSEAYGSNNANAKRLITPMICI